MKRYTWKPNLIKFYKKRCLPDGNWTALLVVLFSIGLKKYVIIKWGST